MIIVWRWQRSSFPLNLPYTNIYANANTTPYANFQVLKSTRECFDLHKSNSFRPLRLMNWICTMQWTCCTKCRSWWLRWWGGGGGRRGSSKLFWGYQKFKCMTNLYNKLIKLWFLKLNSEIVNCELRIMSLLDKKVYKFLVNLKITF